MPLTLRSAAAALGGALVTGALAGGAPAARPAAAQTPYAPVALPPGQVVLSLDTQAHPDRAAGNGWVWALPGVLAALPPRATSALPGRAAVGVRLSVFEPLGAAPQHDAIPQLSWLAVDDTTRGLRLGATAYGLVPLRRAPGSDASGVALATGTWTRAASGTSVTLGAYHFFARDAALGDRRGVIVEGAQALGRVGRVPVGAVASWFQGQNLFGYLTTQLQLTLGAQYLLVGWARGNAPRDNAGPALSWGVAF
jgi:hypothetical protein